MSASDPTQTSSVRDAPVLKTAVRGNFGLAVLGIVFGLLSRSHAILLDGVESLSNGAIALLFQQVDRRLCDATEERLPFADNVLEPLLEILRGSVLLGVLGLAGLTAIADALRGGRSIWLEVATVYGVVVTLGGAVLAAYQGKQAQHSTSPLGNTDARHWFAESGRGAAIALLCLVVASMGEAGAEIARYVDPLLVLLRVALSVSAPWRTVRDGWRELVDRPDEERFAERVRSNIQHALRAVPYEDLVVRVGQFGRLTYVQVYLVVAPDREILRQLRAHDRIRQLVRDRLTQMRSGRLALNVTVTGDRQWIARAVGNADSAAAGTGCLEGDS